MAIKVYVVIIEDRHTDIEVMVFSGKKKAIKVAKQAADSHSRTKDRDEYPVAGCIYHCTYSGEGDCVSVKERFIDRGVQV